jgi:hypothetical protein
MDRALAYLEASAPFWMGAVMLAVIVAWFVVPFVWEIGGLP